jgi:tetratricopeptide (TPR) repeat protein/tRNA A-37 threonylcarbamoyl transferase component Bud32
MIPESDQEKGISPASTVEAEAPAVLVPGTALTGAEMVDGRNFSPAQNGAQFDNTDKRSPSLSRLKTQDLEADTDAIESGTLINGRYLVINMIGAGGMGAVCRVLDTTTQKTYALKMIAPELSKQKKLSKRLRQEAQAAKALCHPNIVGVYDVGVVANDTPFFVMDCIEGTSLQGVLDSQKQLPSARALPIFIQIADALVHAHSKGIVHRDLKPSNILLTQDSSGGDFVKIVDFGIAKVSNEDAGAEQTKLTQTGEVIGSPSYMSPEQCRGYAVDGRSDIYSLGCIMYEVLSGRCPFEGDNTMSVILKHLFEPVDALPDQGAIGDQLRQLVMHCLEKEPNDRYPDAAALLSDLMRLKAGKAIAVVRRKAKWSKSSVSVAIGVGATVALAAVIGGSYLAGNKLKTYLQSSDTTENQPAASSWNALDLKAQRYMNLGDYAKAIESLQRALSTAGSESGNKKLRTLKKLAMIYHIQGDPANETRLDAEIDRCIEERAHSPRQMQTFEDQDSEPVIVDELTSLKKQKKGSRNIESRKPATRAQNAPQRSDMNLLEPESPPVNIDVTALQRALELIPTSTGKEQQTKVESIAGNILDTTTKAHDAAHKGSFVVDFLAQVIPNLERLLGRDLPITNKLKSMYADSLVESGEFERALAPSLECLAYFRKHPGDCNEDLNQDLVRVAQIYNWQGSPALAEPCAREVADSDTLRPPAKMTAKQQLLSIRGHIAYGDALLYQNRLRQAAPQFAVAADLARAVGNGEELETALRKACNIYEVQNDFSKAEQFLLSLLHQSGNTIGVQQTVKDQSVSTHSIANTRSPLITAGYEQALGELYFRQPRNTELWKKSESHLIKALQIRQQYLSPEAPEVISSLQGLMSFDMQAQKYQTDDRTTRALGSQLLATRERTGSSPSNIAAVQSQLAFLYYLDNQRPPAAAMLESVIKLAMTDDKVTSAFDEHLYQVAAAVGKPETMKRIEQLMLKRVDATTSSPQPVRASLAFAQALDDLGHVYFKEGRTAEAGSMITRACDIVFKLKPGLLTVQERWQAADIVQNKAILLHHQGQPTWSEYQTRADSYRRNGTFFSG